jgi:hypothetical protein
VCERVEREREVVLVEKEKIIIKEYTFKNYFLKRKIAM